MNHFNIIILRSLELDVGSWDSRLRHGINEAQHAGMDLKSAELCRVAVIAANSVEDAITRIEKLLDS